MPNISQVQVGSTTYDIQASQLATARKINGVAFNGSADISNYGVSSTAAGTITKTVSVTGFSLIAGARVSVKFTNAQEADSVLLNVSSTGAKTVKLDTAVAAGVGAWNAGETVDFTYDGTNWLITGVTKGEMDTVLQNYALNDGAYENMTVGNAEQLVSTVFVNDQVPYAYRTSGGSADIGDREYDQLVGGTIAWNQLVDTSDTSVTVPNGHKYIASIGGTLSMGTSAGTALTVDGPNNDMVIDLTQAFGTTIADYIYTLETNNAGDGVAWVTKLFPQLNGGYYPYNAGTLLSVSGVSAHNMTGLNQWDEEWELGGLDPLSGAIYVANDRIRSKNFCPCLPNTVYYASGNHGQAFAGIYFYDANEDYVGYYSNTSVSNKLFTTDPKAYYFKLAFISAYGTTYNHDICINLHWDGEMDGTYEPYKLNSYPLDDSLTLRGIPMLDANNALYYDGDTYAADGTVTRRYILRTFDGTENWVSPGNTGTYQRFYCTTYTDASTSSNTNIISDRFVTNGIAITTGGDIDSHGSWVAVYNGSVRFAAPYADATAWKAYLAAQYSAGTPLTVVYELATPTTETADSYQSPQIVNDFGTEEYVTTAQSGVLVPVGHNTNYANNLRAKLEMAPESPAGDGDYIVRQSGGQNSYVPLTFPVSDIPAFPTTDGTYTLQVVVSGGAGTASWVSA